MVICDNISTMLRTIGDGQPARVDAWRYGVVGEGK
jgi:hypothetical protein